MKLFTSVFVALFCVLLLFGCNTFSPGGTIFSTPSSPYIYKSTVISPKTVRISDLLKENEVFFEMEIPAGKTLVLKFLKNQGDDSIYAPDLMKYGIFANAEASGDLENAMSVPGSASRLIDVFIRNDFEARESDEPRLLRSDELLEQDYYINKFNKQDEQ